MNLSEKSLSLLKSLSKVSKSVYLTAGRVQRAASPNSTVVCEVTLDDELPADFGVYDMNALLNFIKGCSEPDIEFTPKTVSITDKTGWKAVFAASSKELINTVDTMDDIDNDPIVLVFDLPVETLKRMIDIATVNSLPQIGIIDTPDGIIMKAFEKDVNGSNCITVPLTTEKKDVGLCVKTPFITSTVNLKIEGDSYRVMIAEMGFARFESLTTGRRYVVSTEMES